MEARAATQAVARRGAVEGFTAEIFVSAPGGILATLRCARESRANSTRRAPLNSTTAADEDIDSGRGPAPLSWPSAVADIYSTKVASSRGTRGDGP